MSTGRPARVATIAVAVLGAGAAVAVYLLTEPARPTAGPAQAPPTAPGPQGAPDVAFPPAGPPRYAGAKAPAPAPEWTGAPLIAAATPAVARALAGPIAHCLDEDVQARFGPSPHLSLPGPPGSTQGPTSVLLYLEVQGGEMKVVDAPVATPGAAEDGLLACAQQVLRGRAVPLGSLEYRDGDRVRMRYELPTGQRARRARAAAGTGAPADAPSRPFQRQRGKRAAGTAP